MCVRLALPLRIHGGIGRRNGLRTRRMVKQSYLFEPSWIHQELRFEIVSNSCLGIAQAVEHLIWDQEVVGAGPTAETKICPVDNGECAMKIKLKCLIPNEYATKIIRFYENCGYAVALPPNTSERELWETSEIIGLCATVGARTFALNIPKSWFDIKDELKLDTWYPSESFDDNPKGYIIIEQCYDDERREIIYRRAPSGAKELSNKCLNFMYLEPE